MGTLSIKNFERYQHYKDRRPLWIKLYNDLLDDYEFSQLSDNLKWHLVAMWLLASRYNNLIPCDPTWIAKQIGATTPVDVGTLITRGFVTASDSASDVLATPEQVAIPEKRQRREETDKSSDAKASGRATKTTNPLHTPLKDFFVDSWQRKRGGKYDYHGGRDSAAIGRILKACNQDIETARRYVALYLSTSDPFYEKQAYSLGWAAHELNRLMPTMARQGTQDADQYRINTFKPRGNHQGTNGSPIAVVRPTGT
jgi:hypothetical protein